MNSEVRQEPQRLRLRQYLAEVAQSYRDNGRRLWPVALFLLAATAVIAYLTYLHELRPEGLAMGWALKPVHALVTIWAMIAGYRALLTDKPGLWRWDAASFRFLAGTLVEFLLAIAAVVLARLWTGALLRALDIGPPTSGTVRIIVIAIVAIIVSIAFLRAQAWLVGLAIDRREVTLHTSWERSSPMVPAMLGAWIPVLVPLMAIYAAIEAVAERTAPIGAHHLALAAFGGTIETAIAVATVLFNGAVFRLIVRDLEPARGRPIGSAVGERG